MFSVFETVPLDGRAHPASPAGPYRVTYRPAWGTCGMAHIRLNTHPAQGSQAILPVNWGARDPAVRGPVVGTVSTAGRRNAIGVHAGSYGVYRALAIAARELRADHRPDLTNTSPAEPI